MDGTLHAQTVREGIFIASANLGGPDRTSWFWGGSSILGPSRQEWSYHGYAGGPFVAEGSDEEAMYTATIDLSLATRFLYKYNPSVGDTDWRPDLHAKWFSELAGDPEFGKKEA
jgi:predicted amidohydrolase